MSPIREVQSRYDGDETYISPEAQRVLVTYSGIASADVVQHVLSVRAKGLAILEYPCIALLHFLDHRLKETPYFERMSQRLRDGALGRKSVISLPTKGFLASSSSAATLNPGSWT
jgi:hypothetical protein